jgi:amidase
MADGGSELIDVALPRGIDSALVEYLAEFPYALADYLAAEPTAPRRAFAQVLLAAGDAVSNGFTAGDTKPLTKAYRHVLALRQSFRRELEALMDKHDLDAIAYPVPATGARPIGGISESNSEHYECSAAAVAGVPALAMPAGFSDGLPGGLELMGRAFDEATLISIAAGYEAHTHHRVLPPTTPPLKIEP